jgi:hypothetical protein
MLLLKGAIEPARVVVCGAGQHKEFCKYLFVLRFRQFAIVKGAADLAGEQLRVCNYCHKCNAGALWCRS